MVVSEILRGFSSGSDRSESACSKGDEGLIPGLGFIFNKSARQFNGERTPFSANGAGIIGYPRAIVGYSFTCK